MRFVCLCLLTPGLVLAQFSTTLKPATEKAFEDYRKPVEAGMTWSPRFSAKAGEVTIAPAGKNGAIEVKDGMIHDWSAATIAAGTTVEKVLAVLQDYNNYKNTYAPDVSDSKLRGRDGDHWNAYLQLVKRKGITAVLNSEYDVEYKSVGPGRWVKVSRSTRIAELDDGKELPPGTGHGFLWRLNAYWLLEQRPEGVYVECRTLSLTRDIPTGLGWAVRPFVSGLPRESLQSTLLATVRAIR